MLSIFGNGPCLFDCISMRAALKNETFVKFEEVNDKIYMVTLCLFVLA